MTTPRHPGDAEQPGRPDAEHADGAVPPPVTFEGQTYTGSPQQPEPVKSKGKRGLVIGAVAVVTLGIVGTAVAAGSMLSGGGAQPEDVLPSGAMAFAKVDFDPAAGQKVALYRLAQKFPDAGISSEESIKDDLLSSFFEDVDDVDYKTDIKPWIGDRAGVSVLPDGSDEDDEPDALAAIAYTDKDAAQAALPELVDGAEDAGFFAFSEAGDFVLIGSSQKAVDAAAKGSSSLADDERFAKATDALEGDQIATAWADLSAVWAALPEEESRSFGEDLELSGQVIMGVHADASFLEVTGRAIGVDPGVDVAQIGEGEGTGLLQQFPDDLLAGFSATGMGDALAAAFEDVRSAVGEETVDDLADQLGLTLPDDLRLLLGDETAIGVFGTKDEPQVVARNRSSDPAGSLAVVKKLASAGQSAGGGSGTASCEEVFGEDFAAEMELTPEEVDELCSSMDEDVTTEQSPAPVFAEEYDEGIAVGSTEEALEKITKAGGLGSSETFKTAVPDAADASVVLYADLSQLIPMFASDEDLPDLAALRAVGMTAKGGENGTFRLRLTVE